MSSILEYIDFSAYSQKKLSFLAPLSTLFLTHSQKILMWGGEKLKIKIKILSNIILILALISPLGVSALDDSNTVTLGGEPFGIKMLSEGVMVVDTDENINTQLRVKDIILDKIVVIPKEEFEANRDRYEGATKNKRHVFDKLENKRKRISKEEFEANRDRYEPIKITEKIRVKENGKTFYVSKEEYSTGKYKHFLHNTVTAFDTVEEKYKVIPKEEYHNNRDRYLNCNSKEYKNLYKNK